MFYVIQDKNNFKTMIVRIFLPKLSFYLSSPAKSAFQYIFGKIIKSEHNGNVTVFITGIGESPTNNIKSKLDNTIIGTICKNANKKEKLHGFASEDDYICFERNETTQTLDLKSMFLPNFIDNIETRHTQIFLYDLDSFKKLAHQTKDNFNEKLMAESDSISRLLFYLKNDNLDRSQKISSLQKSVHLCQQQILLSLITIATFAQKYLSFLDSAFLQHFRFWSMNLDKYTFKS